MSKKQKCFYSRPYGFHKVDIRQTGVPELDGWNGSTNKSTRAEDYNMAKLLIRKPGEPIEMPEYVGPVEICHLVGRGRGVTATQDISPGQLLIVSKALAIVYPNPDLDTSSRLVQDVQKMGELRTAVAELLQINTAASKLVYQLHAGPKLGVMEPNEAEASIGTVDMERIERICALNGFESSYQTESKGSSYGLWFLPSFLNHDCSGSNAHWTVFQNYMFIRATKRVLKDEEILISYMDPNQSWSLRRRFYLKHEFQCTCSLCTLEKVEGQTVRRKRDILLEDFKDEASDDPEVIQEYVEDLDSLRRLNPELNIFLVQPLIQLGLSLYETGKYAETAQALERVSELCKISAQFSLLGVSCALTIATCYLRLGNVPEAKNWFEKSKVSVLVQFGTLSAAEIIRPSFVQEMKYAGFELEYEK